MKGGELLAVVTTLEIKSAILLSVKHCSNGRETEFVFSLRSCDRILWLLVVRDLLDGDEAGACDSRVCVSVQVFPNFPIPSHYKSSTAFGANKGSSVPRPCRFIT